VGPKISACGPAAAALRQRRDDRSDGADDQTPIATGSAAIVRLRRLMRPMRRDFWVGAGAGDSANGVLPWIDGMESS